jgi:exopolyphosphatase / guanosine-5'-triphosphate,3'-diphosphate pyrophosphatase
LNEEVGIIDVGSNSMRLVIYKKEIGMRYKEIENIKAVARLREYLNEDNVLVEDGIQLLLNILISFQEITRYHKLKYVKCVATATIRQAENQFEIVKKVKELTDFSMEVLTEYEESYFGFLAVVNSTSIENGITIDIGGGSTEVTLFKNRQLRAYHSFPFGVISLKQQFIHGDTPTIAESKQLNEFVRSQFSSLPWLLNQKLPIVAIGGSARNVVQIDQARKGYPLAGLHQYEMNYSDITFIKNGLAGLHFADMQKIEGLSKDRADVIIPALEVFESLLHISKATSFVLSKRGLREGVFYDELLKSLNLPLFPSVVDESFHDISLDFEINNEHVSQLTNIATFLMKELKDHVCIPLEDKDHYYLQYAAKAFYLGDFIDSESSSQHTFYLLANRTIDGLMHKERLIVALLASYKSKQAFKQYISPFLLWFQKEELKKLRFLGTILKLSYSLNCTKRSIIKEISVKDTQLGTYFYFGCNQNWMPEQFQAEKQKRQLEKVLKKEVHLVFYQYIS